MSVTAPGAAAITVDIVPDILDIALRRRVIGLGIPVIGLRLAALVLDILGTADHPRQLFRLQGLVIRTVLALIHRGQNPASELRALDRESARDTAP